MPSWSDNVKHLQRVCCSGLSGEIVMQELLRDLHALIPSHSNVFMWCDDRHEITNTCGEDATFFELMPVYLKEFHDLRASEVLPPFAEFMQQAPTVTHARRVVGEDRRFYTSAWYSEIVRPCNWRNISYTKMFSGERPLGLLLQGHDSAPAQLKTKEARLMLDLAPFIAHALTQPKQEQAGLSEADDFGLLIFDLHGELQYQSAQARELLFLTVFPKASARTFRESAKQRLPHFVKKLCDQLMGVARRRDVADAPSHVHRNDWGRFHYRAHWLDGTEGSAIAITIRKQVPTALLLLRKIKTLGLPPRQAEVCLHVASGLSHAAIARKLGITVHAVDWHTRHIYARLDVHNAAQLGQKLLAEAATS